MRSYIFTTLSLVCVVFADYSPDGSDFIVKETHSPSATWKKIDASIPNNFHFPQITFGLRHGRIDELLEYLVTSSDPNHEMYGKHMMSNEAFTYAAPTEASFAAFVEWCEGHGINIDTIKYSPARDWAIWENAPIRMVEEMLDTKYSWYEHTVTGERIIRTEVWSLPETMHEHIDVVLPTTNFMRITPFVKIAGMVGDENEGWKGTPYDNPAVLRHTNTHRTDGTTSSSQPDETRAPFKLFDSSHSSDDAFRIYRHDNSPGFTRIYEFSPVNRPDDSSRTYKPDYTPTYNSNDDKPSSYPSDVSPDYHRSDNTDTSHSATKTSFSIPRACKEYNYTTPKCLRVLYGTIDYRPKSVRKNNIGVNNYLNQVSNRSDTYLFLNRYRPEATSGAFSFSQTLIADGDGYQGQENEMALRQHKDLVADLDAETILGIAYPTRLATYNTGMERTGDPFLNFLLYKYSNPRPRSILSTSYGGDEQDAPCSYLSRICQGFAILGAMGNTLLFASGNSGVGDSEHCDGKHTPPFSAVFPASCPYVTAVGGTRNFDPEIVGSDDNGYVTGGGFSRCFQRPWYQEKVVPPYVASLGTQFKGLYNPHGRGYPDVSAQSYRYVVVWNGTKVLVDGTSCATPTFAGVLALVNDALIASGSSVLGFFNPFLYKFGFEGLNDVTIGSISGCNTPGFPATEGWDAASGFGSPNFNTLVNIAVQKSVLNIGVPYDEDGNEIESDISVNSSPSRKGSKETKPTRRENTV